ncbi:MAG: amidohydrolase family protein [Nitrospirae bacterium]|nr:amidohydrolase family protein [Nitrospirota bacterium]
MILLASVYVDVVSLYQMRYGFIDLHTHGIGRYDTRTNRPDNILKMAELHKEAGTAAILPTIYSAPIDVMRRNMEAVKQAMKMQDEGCKSSTPLSPPVLRGELKGGVVHRASCILGVHLEGPFLNPLRCGALDKNSFIRPTISSLRKLIAGYEDIIKIITIAPEIPGALKVIEKCIEFGMRVNMGHSDAAFEQAVEGKKAGATGVTHIFNAMRPFHHRNPGLAGLGLLDEDVYVEVIADGIHLHPKTLELIFSKKRLDRIMLVSDSVVKAAKEISKKGILTGGGITLSGSIKVLKGVGIPDAEIMEAAIDNPKRYLSL